jgi:hypothetical protein
MMDDSTRPTCCPGEPRIAGTFMSDDCHVVDVHRHKGMLRGLVLDGGPKPRALTWHRDGRLSPKVKSPFDLEKVG